MLYSKKGIVTAGHIGTAQAARDILDVGGNAYDAVLAAFFASCVCEPVLSSLGGGGFLLAQPSRGEAKIYDFFVHTPIKNNTANDLDFYPITAKFGGGVKQDFYIGYGSIAVPGAIAGIFAAHKELGCLPMKEIVAPAMYLARDGVTMNHYQGDILKSVSPIYEESEDARKIFATQKKERKLTGEGEVYKMLNFADFLDQLAIDEKPLFYDGPLMRKMVLDCQERGGFLTEEDFRNYQVFRRDPLSISYRGATFVTNPPPSSGGILVAFALKILEKYNLSLLDSHSAEFLDLLATVMHVTNKAHLDESLSQRLYDSSITSDFLDDQLIRLYVTDVYGRSNRLGSTTHISVIDSDGNLASMTVTNGEGSGYMVPYTGIMMNNLLGEENIHMSGTGTWEKDTRISSTMAPSSVLLPDGRYIAFGSGGGSRIRTILLQFLIHLIDYDFSLKAAIEAPRIHFEQGILSVENGFSSEIESILKKQFSNVTVFPQKDMFFGGINAVCHNLQSHVLSGMGDGRRDGIVM